MTDPRYNPVPPPPPPPPPGATPAGAPYRPADATPTPTPTPPPTLIGQPASGGGWGPPVEPSPPSGLLARRGVPKWVAMLAAATAVLSVVAFVTVLLWPTGEPGNGPAPTGPLPFHAFEQVARIDFDAASRTAFTRMHEDQAYVAWEQGGNLELVAADVASGDQRWRERITGSPRWADLYAVPGAVVAVGGDESGDPAQLYAHDADNGQQLWRQAFGADDGVAVVDGTLVWYESGTALRGLNLTTGNELWSHPISADAAAVLVDTEVDLGKTIDLHAFSATIASDPRLVVINDDGSARTINTSSGDVVSEGANIARPGRDQLTGYDGRLYVATDDRGFQLESYDVEQLSAVPQVHYRAGAEQYPESVEPCGAGRICLLELEGFSRDTTEVVVVDGVGTEGVLWRAAAPDAQAVLPVGPLVMVLTREGAVVFGATGQEILQWEGVATRLNPENMLFFSGSLRSSEQDVAAAGIAVEGERRVELGQLRDVIGEECSWVVAYLACPDRDGATIWRFADA